MVELLVLLLMGVVEEPRRAIDQHGIELFVESQRPPGSGPGRIVASSHGDYDGDADADVLVVYTYQKKPAQTGASQGLFAVAFLTENFKTTDVLIIPASEIVPDTIEEYSSTGAELTIRGSRRLPGDATCCPSTTVSIVLSVKDGKVVLRRSE